MPTQLFERSRKGEHALLIQPHAGGAPDDAELDEFSELARSAGRLRDIKYYLQIFCYFLQPTPVNIRSMVLYAIKHYVPDERVKKSAIKVPPPETMPAVAIYHPDAPKLFDNWELIHAISPDLTLYGIALAFTNHHIKYGT